jgi:hypothetical protein
VWTADVAVARLTRIVDRLCRGAKVAAGLLAESACLAVAHNAIATETCSIPHPVGYLLHRARVVVGQVSGALVPNFAGDTCG